MGSGYEEYITLDLFNDMHDDGTSGLPNTSCYIRIPFDVTEAELETFRMLELKIRYDDGFIAYLNGAKVAQFNTPDYLVWNSAATTVHEAEFFETFDISSYLDTLHPGKNLLAIQGLNTKTSSSDFLIHAKLVASDRPSAGHISPVAKMYSDPVTINESVYIKARTFFNGEWSAQREQYIMIPEDFFDLKVTEVHYHPVDEDLISGSRFEFLELKNTGNAILDMKGVEIKKGIYYTFTDSELLGPQEFIVLASDKRSFKLRYKFMPYDEYKGQLNNDGEKISIINALSDTILSFTYNDGDEWPPEPDGGGYSLVPVEYNPDNDQNAPWFWRASYEEGGSPGRDDTPVSGETGFRPDSVPRISFSLGQNYPNPFSDVTYINYQLNYEALIDLSVYNITGQLVIRLERGIRPRGLYQIEWNGTDRTGNQLQGGIYFYRLNITTPDGNKMITRKLMLIR